MVLMTPWSGPVPRWGVAHGPGVAVACGCTSACTLAPGRSGAAAVAREQGVEAVAPGRSGAAAAVRLWWTCCCRCSNDPPFTGCDAAAMGVGVGGVGVRHTLLRSPPPGLLSCCLAPGKEPLRPPPPLPVCAAWALSGGVPRRLPFPSLTAPPPATNDRCVSGCGRLL